MRDDYWTEHKRETRCDDMGLLVVTRLARNGSAWTFAYGLWELKRNPEDPVECFSLQCERYHRPEDLDAEHQWVIQGLRHGFFKTDYYYECRD